MRISVIVPTYKRSNILPMCLNSLMNQDYPVSYFEIIVVDNNSNDDTKEVVERYINKGDISVSYVFEPRQGLVYARHAGAKKANGDLLVFTDDDGILSPVWLKEIVRVYELNEEVCAVAGKILIRWDEPPPEWVIPYENLLGKLDYGNEIIIKRGLYINGGNFSIKKKVLYQLGGFNPDQIGEWLIGDGETGLCHKLHEANCLIGWAPDALMEHYQIVKKNATLKDIKRRYINNGRCVVYRIYAIQRRGIGSLVKNLCGALFQTIRCQTQLIYFMANKNNSGIYETNFQRAFFSSQFQYTFRIFIDKGFRSMLLKKDWF